MAISLQADSTLPQGYILVNGQRVASVSTTGGLSATLADNTVTTSSLVSGSVTTEKIAPGAVVTADLADGAVTTEKIANLSVETNKIAPLAVNSNKITNNTITADKLFGGQAGTAPIYGCRAWVNFDGTGSNGTNQTIRASGNITNVLKNATGDYTIFFGTSMPDANYCMMSMTTGVVAGNVSRNVVVKGSDAGGPTNKTTTQVTIQVGSTASATLVDMKEVCLAFIG